MGKFNSWEINLGLVHSEDGMGLPDIWEPPFRDSWNFGCVVGLETGMDRNGSMRVLSVWYGSEKVLWWKVHWGGFHWQGAAEARTGVFVHLPYKVFIILLAAWLYVFEVILGTCGSCGSKGGICYFGDKILSAFGHSHVRSKRTDVRYLGHLCRTTRLREGGDWRVKLLRFFNISTVDVGGTSREIVMAASSAAHILCAIDQSTLDGSPNDLPPHFFVPLDLIS